MDLTCSDLSLNTQFAASEVCLLSVCTCLFSQCAAAGGCLVKVAQHSLQP